MTNFPDGRRYSVRDPATGLVHQAMAYDEEAYDKEAYGAVLTIHATWCLIERGLNWVQCDDEPLSCLSCLSETIAGFRVIMKPGLAIINTKAISKINFP